MTNSIRRYVVTMHCRRGRIAYDVNAETAAAAISETRKRCNRERGLASFSMDGPRIYRARLSILDDGRAPAMVPQQVQQQQGQAASVYIEARTLAGDVVRRHGPFDRTSAEFSNAYHAEECATLGHNRMRRHDDESCQRAHIVPAPRMVPQQCQQQQACAAAFAEQLDAAPICVEPNRLSRQDCEALAPGRRVQHKRHNWSGNTWRRLTVIEAGAIRETHDITGTAEKGPGIARELVCSATTHDDAGRVLTRETVRFQVYA